MSKSYEIRSQPFDTAKRSGVVLCLRFYEQGDRFTHQIFAEWAGQSQELLNSVEGNDQDAWPPSPPFQDMHGQQMDNGTVVMGVGMAGTGHWSMSCELDQTKQRVRFVFDVACRIKSTPEFLGSTYAGACVDKSEAGQRQLADLGLSVQFHSIPSPQSSTPSTKDNNSQVPNGDQVAGVWHEPKLLGSEQVTRQIKVLAERPHADGGANTATKQAPETVRWLYALEFSPSVE